MSESLDIVRRLDEDPAFGPPALAPASKRTDIDKWIDSNAMIIRRLTYPRHAQAPLPEFQVRRLLVREVDLLVAGLDKRCLSFFRVEIHSTILFRSESYSSGKAFVFGMFFVCLFVCLVVKGDMDNTCVVSIMVSKVSDKVCFVCSFVYLFDVSFLVIDGDMDKTGVASVMMSKVGDKDRSRQAQWWHDLSKLT